MIFSNPEAGDMLRFSYFGERRIVGKGRLFAVEAEVLKSGESAVSLASLQMNEGNPSVQIKQGKATGLSTTSLRQTTKATNASLRVSPNPAAVNSCRATFTAPTSGVFSLSLVNMLGQEVLTMPSQSVQAGEHTIELSIADVPRGVYVCRLRGQNVELATTVMIMR